MCASDSNFPKRILVGNFKNCAKGILQSSKLADNLDLMLTNFVSTAYPFV